MNYRTLATSTAVSLILCSTSVTSYADTLGFRLGAYSWTQNYDGNIQSSGSGLDEIDITDDLGFDDETGTVIFFALEHPIPILPNILIQQTELEINEDSDTTIIFDGVAFTSEFNSDSDLSHTDLTLYYEVLDNWVNLDLGLTIRNFDGGVVVSNDFGIGEEEIEETIPMIYIAAKFDLPLTGLYVGASANGMTISDATLIDYQLNLGYETSIGLGIEAGMRNFTLDYDDDGDEADVTIDGAYIGAFYHF